MTAKKLTTRRIEKVWGRHKLTPWFPDAPADGEPVGEIWYEMEGVPADAPELLVKFLFTSEKLSIQVHPDDEAARARGYPRGKDEAWLVLAAEPHATIGLGLKRAVSRDELRAAALDGSIERLIDWRPIRAGDVFTVVPGTIHAIGAGISLLEFQQNADVTYRLYDYGRPRELHLDDAIAVALRAPYPARLSQHLAPDEDRTLVDGPHFTLLHTQRDSLQDRLRWVIPLTGEARSGDEVATVGDCLLLEAGARLEPNGRMLIGARP